MEDMKPASKWQMMLEDLASQFPAAQSAIDEIKDIIGGGEQEPPAEETPAEEATADDLEAGQMPTPIVGSN